MLEVAESFDVALFAFAQHHKLRAAFDYPGKVVGYEIHAFLVREPAYYSEQSSVGVYFKAELFLQSLLAAGLSAEGIRGVVHGDVFIAVRVETAVVYSVYYTPEAVLSLVEEPVQAFSEPLGADLVRVGGGDGAYKVGVAQAAQQVVGASVPGAHLPVGVGAQKPADITYNSLGILALELQVVYSQHGLDAVESVEVLVLLVEVHWY